MRKSLLLAAVALSLLLPAAAYADITVYSAGPADLITTLAKGFTAKSGVKVNVFQGTTGQIMGRIQAEAANPVVDVVISASWDTATDFTNRGWLLPYTSPNAAMVPAEFKSDSAVAEGISALVLAWNPKSGTPKPAEWTDLAKPDYKNLVVIPDPAQSGSSSDLVAAMEAQYGWKLFQDMKADGAIVGGANAASLTPVLQGAKAAVFGAVDYLTYAAISQGESVQAIVPASGTVIAPRPMLILKWSKQPDQAKQFIDYVLSDERQTAIANDFLIPARSDIAAKRPLVKDMKVMQVNNAAQDPNRDKTLATFADTFK